MVRANSNPVFRLKSNQFTFPVLQLLKSDLIAFNKQLSMTIQQTPNFFQHAPLVVDVSQLTDLIGFELQPLYNELRSQNLIPIGIRGASEKLQEEARALGLAIIANSQTKEGKKTKTNAPTQTAPQVSIPAKIITSPIRSGQQVYAQGGDLIVFTSVSPGAEVLADGHIHVYGSLRGRALAGIMGDSSARIFCKALSAELVSIAGRFLLSEDLVVTQDSTQIFLENDRLQIASI